MEGSQIISNVGGGDVTKNSQICFSPIQNVAVFFVGLLGPNTNMTAKPLHHTTLVALSLYKKFDCQLVDRLHVQRTWFDIVFWPNFSRCMYSLAVVILLQSASTPRATTLPKSVPTRSYIPKAAFAMLQRSNGQKGNSSSRALAVVALGAAPSDRQDRQIANKG